VQQFQTLEYVAKTLTPALSLKGRGDKKKGPNMKRSICILLCLALLAGCSYFNGGLSDNDKAAIQATENARKSGHVEESVNLLRALQAKNPENPDILRPLGYALIDANRPDEAVKVFDTLITLKPDDTGGYNGKAVALDHMDNHEGAQALYEQALKISPDSPTIQSNLGMSMILNGQYKEAVKLLEPLNKPGAKTLRRNLAMAYALSGDKKKALALDMEDMPAAEAQENMRFYEAYAKRHKTPKKPAQKQTGFSDTPQ